MNSSGIRRKNIVVSISGKGGSGKTTLAALLLRVLLGKSGGEKSILLVDADPAANLPEVLGLKVEKTVGMVASELKARIGKGTIPLGESKATLLETWIYGTMVETPKFDLLVMGRSEGEGCYCYVNSVLTKILDVLNENYDIVLLDMEAGLEHLSRRTDKDVDALIIVTDASKMGFETSRRITELVREVHIEVKGIHLVGNKFPEEMEKTLLTQAEKMEVNYGGIIPQDLTISEYNLQGKSLLTMPGDNPAVKAAESIAKRVGLLPA